jgi:hypothetical protein
MTFYLYLYKILPEVCYHFEKLSLILDQAYQNYKVQWVVNIHYLRHEERPCSNQNVVKSHLQVRFCIAFLHLYKLALALENATNANSEF